MSNVLKTCRLLLNGSKKKKYGAKKFHLCPGMSDYAKAGYIVPAWCDIEFIANSAGVRAHRGETEGSDRKVKFGNEPFEMGTDIPDGFVDIDPNIQFKVFKFDSPWQIFCAKSISALTTSSHIPRYVVQ